MKNLAAKRVCLAMLAFALVLSGCQSKEASDGSAADKSTAESAADSQSTEEETVEIYDTKALFGEFVTYTQEGEEVSQEIFAEADLTMVNIWGTFCSPCIAEMPDLGELAEEYADKNVAIVGIISDVYEAGNETAQQIIDQTGADYTHLIHSEDIYNNFLRLIQVVPTTVFVNSEGMRVGDVIMGSKDKEAWIQEIEKRLEAVTDEE